MPKKKKEAGSTTQERRGMKVKGNHPLAEVIAKRLFSIESVPKDEQRRMVNRACRDAVEYYEQYVIKARIEELERIPAGVWCNRMYWSSDDFKRERLAQLKKGVE